MKKLLIAIALGAMTTAHAGTFATLPNKAGGKIVLTDENCVMNGTNYPDWRRVYNYGTSGQSSEGCWNVEDEVIVVVWSDSSGKYRYPMENFTLAPKYQKKNNRGSM
jgi:hypothetical protein